MSFLTKAELMKRLIEKRNGYLLSGDIADLGISKTYMSEFVKKNNMERIAQGVYMSADAWQDDLYILCLRNSKVVLSHESALQIHELTEREPNGIHVAVPQAYNATHLREQGINVHQSKDELYELGAITAVTKYGNPVKVYDAERTICDMVKSRAKKDPQVFLYALKEFAKSKEKNVGRLMRYAKRLGVEKEVRTYMEVLL